MLAVMLGELNVDAMLRRITAKQLLMWEAYYALEPFGEIRADWRAASIRQMVHNSVVSKENQKEVKDFLLQFSEPDAKPRKTWQQMAQMARMIASIYNAPGTNVD